ncbi:MAG: VWA domain-containing protein, partial [Myxococcota bacterium]|nr:VWA domain-containing protein [Myxococcota bacterium]
SAYSPSHLVGVERVDDKTVVSYREAGAKLDQDFQLYYTLTAEPVGMSVVDYRLGGEDGYFLLMAAPGDPENIDDLPKDITFVIDTSGSMTGDKMAGVREALRYCLESLNPADRFTVVRFAEGAETLSPRPLEATPAAVEAGLAFVDGLEPLGGTNIYAAVDAALAYRAPAGRPHYVVMLTDGTPTVGVTSSEAITKLARSRTEGTDGQVRIFAFGLGYDVSTGLLDTLAAENRGTADYLQPGEDVEWVISSFFRRVSRPVVTDLQLDLGNAQAFDVYPAELPDLYSGTQLLVLGRYKGRGDQTIRLTGTANGQPVEFSTRAGFTGQEQDDADFLPRLWASRKVGFLLDEIRREGETPERIEEVQALGYRHGILTPYNSFLATEDMPVADLLPAEDPADALKVLWRANADARASGGMDRAFADAFRGFGDDTGADAVHASLAIDALQGASQRAWDAPSQAVGDRVFHFRGGVWIDEAFDADMDTLSVRSMSDGYFALLWDRDDLRRYAAMGESVVVVVGDDRAVFFTPGGDDLRPGKLSAFVGR